jgi:hypothetical protein
MTDISIDIIKFAWMILMRGFINVCKLKCIVVVAITLAAAIAQGRPGTAYVAKLGQAGSREEFEKAFNAMITSFHAGKVSFQNEDVTAIVELTREKSFAQEILPRVYGWAGSMFGDGRMDAAIVYFMESAQLYELQKNKSGQALSFFEIALVQHKAENYEEAKEYYK